MKEIREFSPRFTARVAGALYLISGTAFTFGENTVRGKLIVAGDAAATVAQIVAHEVEYRRGLGADLVASALYVVVTVLLYFLLKPVNRIVALLAMVMSLIGCVLGLVAFIFHIAPLELLKSGPSWDALASGQGRGLGQDLTMLSLRLGEETTDLSMVFFGFFCALIGYLIFQSTFMPRILGILMMLSGSCYLADFFTHFAAPAVAAHLMPYLMWQGIPGEGSLILWLLAIGVNPDKWRVKARAASATNPAAAQFAAR